MEAAVGKGSRVEAWLKWVAVLISIFKSSTLNPRKEFCLYHIKQRFAA